MPEPSGQYVQSLARGLAVIRAFDSGRPSRTLSEIAQDVGLSRATTRRFLLTLDELGYVRSDGRLFQLTPRVLDLGWSFLSGLSLPEVAQPHLERLSKRVGESTAASILLDHETVVLVHIPARRIMTVSVAVGTRFPAYATAMGRVLLAHLPEGHARDVLSAATLDQLTPSTVTTLDTLLDRIEIVRDQGWSLIDQELEVGLRSIAAPVYRSGSIAAAINISTTVAADSSVDDMQKAFLDPLLETAAAISADLDHLEDTSTAPTP